MHLAQASTRSFLPVNKRTHCKFGYFLVFLVGLNFPRNFTRDQAIDDFLAQMAQIFEAIVL